MKTRNTLIKLLLFATAFLINAGSIYAQDSTSKDSSIVPEITPEVAPAESQFMMVGLATFGFVNQSTVNTLGGVKSTEKINSLGDADRYEFSPMFLWRHGDKLLLEFEPSYTGTDGLGINWADISYFVAPGLIVRGGYLVLPFGIYTKRLAAGWINKLASDPIGVDMAGSDFGVEIEGGFPMGNMKGSYDVSLSNGFQLNNDGTIQGVGIQDINSGKTVCGRFSILPFSNSSLEIGVSALYGSLGSPQGATFTNLDITSKKGPNTSMYAADLNYVKNISPVQINIKGQYTTSMVSDQNYINPLDSTQVYTFSNKTSAAFGQISVRPVGARNNVVKNLELAFRYANYTSPVNSTWGQNYNEQDIALDYWFTWRTVLKVAYEHIKTDGTSSVATSGDQGSTLINRMVIQFSTQL
ncbi:MAG: hypothetical protein ABI378_07225 [Chitinophagaceae bacterium]